MSFFWINNPGRKGVIIMAVNCFIFHGMWLEIYIYLTKSVPEIVLKGVTVGMISHVS